MSQNNELNYNSPFIDSPFSNEQNIREKMSRNYAIYMDDIYYDDGEQQRYSC